MNEPVKMRDFLRGEGKAPVPRQLKVRRIKFKHRPHCLYVVDCGYGYLYFGITQNPKKRELQHKGILGGGSYFTKRHGFVSFKILVWFQNKSEAKRVENKYSKLMKRKHKDLTIAGGWVGHLD